MWNVIAFEVRRTLKKKSFWIASILPPLIILGVFGVEYFSAKNAQSSSAQATQAFSQTAKIGALDESGLVNPSLLAADHIAVEPTKDAGIGAVQSGALDAFFYYPADVATSGIQVYAKDEGIGQTPYNDAAIAVLKQSVVASVSAKTGNSQAVAILQKDPNVVATTYKNGAVTNDIADIVVPGFFALAFMLFFVLLGQFIMASTGEEKENRASEILLTSIRARTLIVGKMVSILILGIVQALVIVLPLVIAYLRVPSFVNLPAGISLTNLPLDPVAITIGALFALAGFVMFSGLIMGVGSMVPGSNSNRFIGVFMIWIYVPIYSIALIISSPHTLIVNVLTYFPLTAPTTVLLRNTLGSISIGEAAGAFAIVAASAAFAVWFAVRAFRYGSMEHGRRIGFKELLH